MPRRFIIMHMIDIWQPGLQFVISISNKKHTLGQRLEIRISTHKNFKFLIILDPMLIPTRHVLIHKFLLTFPLKRWNIKHFIPFWIPYLECLLHLKNINLHNRLDIDHRNLSTQWYNHPCFFGGAVLCLFKTLALLNFVWFRTTYIVLSKDIIYACPTPWEVSKQIHNFENTIWSQLQYYFYTLNTSSISMILVTRKALWKLFAQVDIKWVPFLKPRL